jgi:ADP-ribose pyrophosphatase YjhB (NUDIX family)
MVNYSVMAIPILTVSLKIDIPAIIPCMITRRIAVRGIILKDGKIFCQKLQNKTTGRVNSFWATPGGGLDPGESLAKGLEREMIEETGITPQIGNLLFIQQFIEGEKEHLEFFFHIKNVDDYEAIDLSGTTHGLIEIADMEFVDPTAGNVLPKFLQTIDIQKAIDQQKPTEVFSYIPTV